MINLHTPINVTKPILLIIPTIKQPNQPRSTEQINQISCVNQGVFLILLFLSYICVGLKYRKHKEKRAATQQEQLQTLERTWRLAAYKRELDSREH